jgi:hypothetical protein
MQFIDSYCGEVYYIVRTLADSRSPAQLKSTLRTDLLKTMAIGSVSLALGRFTIYKRHYLLKNYVNSLLLGSMLGAAYSPIFLVPKIDKHRLGLLLEGADDSA